MCESIINKYQVKRHEESIKHQNKVKGKEQPKVIRLALCEYKPKTQKDPPQNKTQQPKQSSTSLNYSNDSESYDPKTRRTRPQKKDKGSTQIFKSQENSTR